MPGSASSAEAAAQPQVNTDGDFSLCIIGYSATNPVATGTLTNPYSAPGAAVSDLGCGDAVDALVQAISVTPGNPAPPPASFYSTPATTPGGYGTLTAVLATASTCVPANNVGLTPKGTHQPWLLVATGFTVGVAGGTGYASLDGGRTKKLVSFGTSAEYNFPATDGWPGTGQQAGFTFGGPSSAYAAVYTALNALRTAEIAHFIDVAASVHLAADTTDNVALTAIPVASSALTAVALYNGALSLLRAHGANLTYHTIADVPLATALALLPVAQSIEDVELSLAALIAAYNAHRINITGSVHGSADSTDTAAAYTPPTAPTLTAGDLMYTTTTPPSWADADLYTAGTTATGAFAAIADSGQAFGTLVITEPVAASDFATLVAGLNFGLSLGKRWGLIVRFRDPAAGETDATYIAAFQVFTAANHDNRITCLMGSAWMTDAWSGFVYLRSWLPAYLARLQSRKAVPGQQGEKLAQNPGWVARGPLEGVSLKDSYGNTIGHDEALRAGAEAANGAPTGGGVCLYYQRNAQLQGTYCTNRSTVMYPVSSAILTPMDRQVANALEQVAVGISLTSIGGTDVWDPVTFALDEDILNGIVGKTAKAIRDNYAREFQNAQDPNLVVVSPTVTVAGAQVAITGTLNVRFYGYTDTIALAFAATR